MRKIIIELIIILKNKILYNFFNELSTNINKCYKSKLTDTYVNV